MRPLTIKNCRHIVCGVTMSSILMGCDSVQKDVMTEYDYTGTEKKWERFLECWEQ